MTWTSNRSCSHSTVSICLVHGRIAIPPLPNLSIAVRSELVWEPTTVAIFTSFFSSFRDCVEHNSSRILVFLVENQEISRIRRWQICVDVLSLHFSARLCHFLVSSSNVLMYFLHVLQLYFRRCSSRSWMSRGCNTPVNINILTSRCTVIGQSKYSLRSLLVC